MANILVLIPINPKLKPALQKRCRFLADRMVKNNPKHNLEIIFDSRGPGWQTASHKTTQELDNFVRQLAPLRQQLIDDYLKPCHDYVLWIDADIISYPANLPTELIKRNPNGISAPMVLYEGHGQRFYDTAGFIENSHWCRPNPPFFNQTGPIYSLDGVGCLYLVPAIIYRHGAKHLDMSGFTDHLSVCLFAKDKGWPVLAFGDLTAVHYCSTLWQFSESDGFFKKIYLRLKAKWQLRKEQSRHEAANFNQPNQELSGNREVAPVPEKPFNIAIDRLKKTLEVFKDFPEQMIKYPILAKRLFFVLFKDGPYKAFQNAYDFLQLKKLHRDNYANDPHLLYYSPADYDNFVKTNVFSPLQIKELKNQASRWPRQPKISLIVPVYDIEPWLIKLTLDSVKAQIYDNWELCLANGSRQKKLRKFLDEYCQNDPRIKLKHLDKNYGISGNSNEALKLATGEFVALLDYDDEISADALWQIAKLINQKTPADIIYSDDDKINLNGNYCQPTFKPDWSPDLLLSCCYIGHLAAIRKELIDRIGGFRKQFDGSQDHDLFLRVTELTDKIFHLPKVLYHWRMTPTSAALSVELKPYCYAKTRAAVAEAIKRRKLNAVLSFDYDNGPHYIRYNLKPENFISIIIPTKDQSELIEKCVRSIIEKTDWQNYEIIIVNNNSVKEETKQSFKKLAALSPKIKIIDYNKEFNYSAINNFAAKQARGNLLLFLNDDTEVINDDWLKALAEQAQRPSVGAVGAKLLYPSRAIQHAGMIIGKNNNCSHAFYGQAGTVSYLNYADTIRNYSAVTGACLMIKQELFNKIGGFDENYKIIYSDIDLCFRLRREGYLIVYTPLAKLFHLESATRGLSIWQNDEARFSHKWQGLIEAGDPYYNENLSFKPYKSFYWRGF